MIGNLIKFFETTSPLMICNYIGLNSYCKRTSCITCPFLGTNKDKLLTELKEALMLKISPQPKQSIHALIHGIKLYADALQKEVSKEYTSPQYIKEKTDAIQSNLDGIEGYMEYEANNQ